MRSKLLAQLIYEEIVQDIRGRENQPENDQRYLQLLLALRSALIERGDPLIAMDIGTDTLLVNLSHQLPFYRALFPLYDTALRGWPDA
ncbi:MAG TPA: hypothetical protein PKA10_00570 [Selenomonadales bacterium]|nr:hypothetical protein [Selenomonadales bacterium]